MSLILASASPTRARLLQAAGVAFEQRTTAIDEEAIRASLASEAVATVDAAVILAELKGQRVAASAPDGAIVLAADQLLDLDGAWLAKPVDRADARDQLLALRGRRHRLASAVVGFRDGARVWHHVATADLWLRDFTDGFLDSYLGEAGDAVIGSVGAYQLEGLGAQLMARVEGDHSTILGLPLLPTLKFLRDQGILRR